jgi:hypothetical protein
MKQKNKYFYTTNGDGDLGEAGFIGGPVRTSMSEDKSLGMRVVVEFHNQLDKVKSVL